MEVTVLNYDDIMQDDQDEIKDYITEGLAKTSQFLKDIQCARNELNKQLSIEDKKLCDIRHLIELGPNLNVVQGYKLYKMQQTIVLRRRKIKNNLDRVDIISKSTLPDFRENNKIINKMNYLDRRTYTPRILDELFK